MSRGVYLAGGGSAVDEAAVWDAMLDRVSRLLYWPAALSGSLLEQATSWLRTSLGARSAIEITTWLDLSEHRGEALDGFDLVFVGGGNTFDLLDRLRAAALVTPLQTFLRRGGTYYGGSAGAVVAGLDIGVASGFDPDRHSGDHTGLGLVPYDVLPHFAEPRIELAKIWSSSHPDRPLLCLPESSGVCFDHGRTVVCGPDPVEVYLAGAPAARCRTGETLPL